MPAKIDRVSEKTSSEAEVAELREQLEKMRDVLFNVCVKDASESIDGKPCWCPAGWDRFADQPHCSECLDARKAYFG